MPARRGQQGSESPNKHDQIQLAPLTFVEVDAVSVLVTVATANSRRWIPDRPDCEEGLTLGHVLVLLARMICVEGGLALQGLRGVRGSELPAGDNILLSMLRT